MKNVEIAAVFDKIAQILTLREENVFRIRAYERAAQITRGLNRELADIVVEEGTKGLLSIPGIGNDLASKIEEMVQTGRLGYLTKVSKGIPEGIFALLSIPRLGPRKVQMLWKKFGVKDVVSLKKLLRKWGQPPRTKGTVPISVKGWGEKTTQNILRGIELRESLGTRVSLPEAAGIAEGIIEALKATKLCSQITPAGSLRRMKETIGDIDILVTISRTHEGVRLGTKEKTQKIIEAFCNFPQVKEVLGKGPTKASVILGSGIQADLRVVSEEDFGAALHYFTGSKDHNVKLRTIAVRRGITMSEYGVYRGKAVQKGAKLASRTEEDVFRALKLPWIPPELRENQGEIEAAARGALPKLLEEKDVIGDLHIHTDFSDGTVSAVEMARAAKAAGLRYVAITDHASPMGMVRGIKEGNLREYLGMIERARKAVPGIRILAGTEVDILKDGSLYLSDSVLAKLDWVIASVHQYFDLPAAEQTKRLISAIEHPHVHMLGHPTARLLGRRPGIMFDTDAVLRAAAKHGVAVEINASPDRLDANDALARRAKELGCMFAIGSDAHHPREFTYRFGVAQARRGWVEKKDVVNTRGWNGFWSGAPVGV